MQQGQILVVEDVPNVLELVEVTLRFKGYQVITARNGEEGLEMVKKMHPVLVITDILMPKMDGYAFVFAMRSDATMRRIPVIFLSATYVTPEDRNFALSLGATRFLEKPIDTEEFLLTVAETLSLEPATGPTPLNSREFYEGYRERLEQKLRHKNTQIARTERLLPDLPAEQKEAFEALLEQAVSDRENIQSELRAIYQILDEMKAADQQ